MYVLKNNSHEIKTSVKEKALYLLEIGYRYVDKGDNGMNFTNYELDLYKKWVMTVEYKKVGRKTTIALVTTEQGFEIVGTSACVDAAKYDAALGEDYALKDALKKLDQHVGFYRQMTES